MRQAAIAISISLVSLAQASVLVSSASAQASSSSSSSVSTSSQPSTPSPGTSRAQETVVVTGRAALAGGDQKPLIDQTAFQEEWPPDVRTSVICVPLTAIEGFELRDP